MSTIKADTVTTKSDDTDLTITGGGTGVPNLEAGFKVGGSAGVPTASIQDNAVTLAKMAGLTRGSIIHGDSSGDPAALAVGGANTVLQSDGTDSSYGTVATAMIADDAVTLAKMAAGTDGNIISYDASGNPVAIATGNDGQVLTSTGAGSPPAFEDAAGGGFTAGTPVTVSASAATFSSLPAGLNYIILLANLSSSAPAGGGMDQVQIGDAGGLETTGYQSVTQQVNTFYSSTTFFDLNPQGNGLMYGAVHLLRATGNTWVQHHSYMYSTSVHHVGAGVKTLSGELTQVKFGLYGSGTIQILYQ